MERVAREGVGEGDREMLWGLKPPNQICTPICHCVENIVPSKLLTLLYIYT